MSREPYDPIESIAESLRRIESLLDSRLAATPPDAPESRTTFICAPCWDAIHAAHPNGVHEPHATPPAALREAFRLELAAESRLSDTGLILAAFDRALEREP